METEQLTSEGIYHPGNALAQKVRLINELNCYWLPIYIMFNQFDRSADLGSHAKRIRETSLELYDTRTGEKADRIFLFLKNTRLDAPPEEEYYRLLQYLEGVPKIGTILPSIYVSDFDSMFMDISDVAKSIDEVWKEGYDLSYIKVRPDKELNEFFEEFEFLRSLHESFTTKTPPRVPIQLLVPYHNIESWDRYLVPMGLDIYSIRSERARVFESVYYITNVHRLDDLIASVPRKHLKGIIKLTNEKIVEDLKVEGFKPYKLPSEQQEEVSELKTPSVPEPSLKTCFFTDVDGVETRTSLLVGSICLLLLVSGIVFPLLYFFGR